MSEKEHILKGKRGWPISSSPTPEREESSPERTNKSKYHFDFLNLKAGRSFYSAASSRIFQHATFFYLSRKNWDFFAVYVVNVVCGNLLAAGHKI